MRKNISDDLRAIYADLLVLEKDYRSPEYSEKKVTKPTRSIEVKKDRPNRYDDEIKDIPIRRALSDEESKDVRKAKRPRIKPPRRITDYKAKWKGTDSRNVRKDYQREYRKEHGNGYVKKITTKSGAEVDGVFIVKQHEAERIE